MPQENWFFRGVPHGAERATKGNEKPVRGEHAANIEGSGVVFQAAIS
jgi:hypothetical protein